jgi:thioredoxin reductase (NADPH)
LYFLVKTVFQIMNDEHKYDCVIIGAGPAGIAAAIQAKRLGLDIAIIERDRPGGHALAIHSVESYPGCPFGVTGAQLMSRFFEHLKKLRVCITFGAARGITHDDDLYVTKTSAGTFMSRTLIVATGRTPQRLNVKGAGDVINDNLFFYASPNHVDHRDKRVLILGNDDAAFDQALGFAQKASSVTIAMKNAAPRCQFLLTRRAERRNVKLMRIVTPAAMEKDGDSLRVKLKRIGAGPEAKTVDVTADIVVACTARRADTKFLKPLMKRGHRFPIKPGAVAKWPGLYLVGDICRNGDRQLDAATQDGMRAAMDAYAHLISQSTSENPFTPSR